MSMPASQMVYFMVSCYDLNDPVAAYALGGRISNAGTCHRAVSLLCGGMLVENFGFADAVARINRGSKQSMRVGTGNDFVSNVYESGQAACEWGQAACE